MRIIEHAPRPISLPVYLVKVFFLVPIAIVGVILWGAVQAIIFAWHLAQEHRSVADPEEAPKELPVMVGANEAYVPYAPGDELKAGRVLVKGEAILATREGIGELRARNAALRERVAAMR